MTRILTDRERSTANGRLRSYVAQDASPGSTRHRGFCTAARMGGTATKAARPANIHRTNAATRPDHPISGATRVQTFRISPADRRG